MRISDWSSDVCSSDLCGRCEETPPTQDTAWRRVLWRAPGINAAMFGVEIVAGVNAGSAALKADALDFLGDSSHYAISLGVAGLALRSDERRVGDGGVRTCRELCSP